MDYVKIDGEIVLTKHGDEVAEASIRRHRIIERFMSDILGIEWAVAHREAERLQHAISPLIEDKMLAALGHPTACPHLVFDQRRDGVLEALGSRCRPRPIRSPGCRT